MSPFFWSSFNPHSSFRPSATWVFFFGFLGRNCFNPHSSFRPSATRQGVLLNVLKLNVSILTRAFARVQLGALSRPRDRNPVSILTRAFARVQPTRPRQNARRARFQSSLELSPECNLDARPCGKRKNKFQSSLELSPECNQAQY